MGQQDKVIQDSIYDPNIHTVQVYLKNESFAEQQNQAIRYITQDIPFVLEFDELINDYSDFTVKLIHCNADWTKSQLHDMLFMEDYNEFYIRDMEPGFNTLVQYTHYRFNVPKVKLSGNYVLAVYRNGNEEDLVFTKRFMVFEEKVYITPKTNIPVSGKLNQQQVNFTVNYPEMNLINPLQQVNVVIRQNNRWDNAKFNVQPTFINEGTKEIEYIRLGADNKFDGGNEFRAFDARSVLTTGLNIYSVQDIDSMFLLQMRTQEPRGYQSYLTFQDINGGYIIDQYEYEDATQSDYVLVNFKLEMPEVQGKIYVFGALSNWKINERFQMYYNHKKGKYEALVLLKQGYYNYKFIAVKNDGSLYEHLIEGNHFQTENMYEVLFYYNPPGQIYDLLIGQALFNINDN